MKASEAFDITEKANNSKTSVIYTQKGYKNVLSLIVKQARAGYYTAYFDCEEVFYDVEYTEIWTIHFPLVGKEVAKLLESDGYKVEIHNIGMSVSWEHSYLIER
jgi:hypothetical protein